MPGQTVQVYIRLLLGSSLIRVYTVCHSVCIILTHYSMVEPHSSNFRVITTNILDVRIFRKFTVLLYGKTRLLKFKNNYSTFFGCPKCLYFMVHYLAALRYIMRSPSRTLWGCHPNTSRSSELSGISLGGTFGLHSGIRAYKINIIIKTHIWLMDLSIPINRTSSFPNLGVSGAFFYFHFIFYRISCKQTVQTLIRHRIQ